MRTFFALKEQYSEILIHDDTILCEFGYKVTHYFPKSKERNGKIWKSQKKCLSLHRERRNQVEPRCAERWHLRDDEQFDLAAWFPSLKHSWSRVASYYYILM